MNLYCNESIFGYDKVDVNDKLPPPLPPAHPAEKHKTKDRAYLKLVVAISALAALCVLVLLFALSTPSAINAFNKSRQSAIRKNLAKTAEVTVGSIDPWSGSGLEEFKQDKFFSP
jgi:hypothetical protein